MLQTESRRGCAGDVAFCVSLLNPSCPLDRTWLHYPAGPDPSGPSARDYPSGRAGVCCGRGPGCRDGCHDDFQCLCYRRSCCRLRDYPGLCFRMPGDSGCHGSDRRCGCGRGHGCRLHGPAGRPGDVRCHCGCHLHAGLHRGLPGICDGPDGPGCDDLRAGSGSARDSRLSVLPRH